jgi:hypothetical protein
MMIGVRSVYLRLIKVLTRKPTTTTTTVDCDCVMYLGRLCLNILHHSFVCAGNRNGKK